MFILQVCLDVVVILVLQLYVCQVGDDYVIFGVCVVFLMVFVIVQVFVLVELEQVVQLVGIVVGECDIVVVLFINVDVVVVLILYVMWLILFGVGYYDFLFDCILLGWQCFGLLCEVVVFRMQIYVIIIDVVMCFFCDIL